MALGAAFAAALVIVGMPRLAGAGWTQILAPLAHLGAGQIALLVAVWLAGLIAHTPSLVAALPGLSHVRALQLNLTGSFVANLLPFGGAGGTLVNWSMARAWGFGPGAFATWAILTNVADTTVKLILPVLALTWLSVSRHGLDPWLTTGAVAGLLALVALATATWLIARDERLTRGLGRAAARLLLCVRPGAAVADLDERLAAVRHECLSVGGAGWSRLFGGKIAYAVLQTLLLALALRFAGAATAPSLVLAVFAVERLLSMAVITPSGVGLVETGVAATLIACGTDPAAAVAATLLYRSVVVGLETPVGGLWLAAWTAARRVAKHPVASDFSAERHDVVGAGSASLR